MSDFEFKRTSTHTELALEIDRRGKIMDEQAEYIAKLEAALKPFAEMPKTWVLVAYEHGAQKHVYFAEVDAARTALDTP